MAKGKIQLGAWVEINRENLESIRKTMPAYELSEEDKNSAADPLAANNGPFDVRRGACFVRINDKPKGSPVVLFDYPDGTAAMIADGKVTWSYCGGVRDVDWRFDLKSGGFVDENGNDMNGADKEVRIKIDEAFVVKYARTGVIIRYKGYLSVGGKGYLHTRDGCFPRSQWAKTLDEAKDLYRKASEKAIRSMQKQINAVSNRIDHPTIEDRIEEENA